MSKNNERISRNESYIKYFFLHDKQVRVRHNRYRWSTFSLRCYMLFIQNCHQKCVVIGEILLKQKKKLNMNQMNND